MRRLFPSLAAVALATAGCVGHGAVTTTPEGVGFHEATATSELLSHPRAAPTLTGISLTGARLSTQAYLGKVLVVNFWASWCAPCRGESSALEQAATSYAGKGVVFLGVLTEDTASNGAAFDASNEITYPSIVDGSGIDMLRFSGLGLVTIPDTLVINRSGQVVAKFIGAVDSDHLDAVLSAVAG
jgi:thiol-disulfide isomerase/thioredoxin